MYAHHLSRYMPEGRLRIIADQDRIQRYTEEGIYCNEELCHFNYVTPKTPVEPADLLIFAVKYTHLKAAIEDVANHVGPDTIILSVLNGVVSERDIAAVYGDEKNLYAVSQGMDAVKVGNKMSYKNMGLICFGELDEERDSPKVKAVRAFFKQMALPCEVNNKMGLKLWSKLMLNVGINQTVAYQKGTIAVVQHDGPARDMMLGAMEETMRVAQAEGIGLTQADRDYWLTNIDGLNPDGLPSMAQDVQAGRYSEVELFAGTVISLAARHGIQVPINKMFYDWFTELERDYG
jgi:2-dehydropantoate 2-reductase